MAVKLTGGPEEGINKTRTAAWLHAAKQIGMETGLLEARLGVLRSDVVECSVNSRHSLIDFVLTVFVAQKMIMRVFATLSAIWEATDDTRTFGRAVAMVMTRDAVEKKSTAAGTEIIRGPDLAAAF